jgi:hypothetical protein
MAAPWSAARPRARRILHLAYLRIDRPHGNAVAPAAQLPLQFRLDGSYPRATVAVTTPRGVVETIAVGVSDGWAVAGVALADEVGTQLFVRREAAADGG